MTDSSAIMIEHAADVSSGNFYTGDVCTNCFDYVRMAESFENSHELPQSYFDKVDKVFQQPIIAVFGSRAMTLIQSRPVCYLGFIFRNTMMRMINSLIRITEFVKNLI